MGKQIAPRQWWETLKLGKAAADQMAERGTESPTTLAWAARAAPDDFRRVFKAEVRADLTRALTAHVAAAGESPDAGLTDLLSALEEVEGKRPPKPPAPLPAFGFGVVLNPAPAPPPRPVPPLPKLGPRPPVG